MGPLILSVVFNAGSLDISGPQGGLCILLCVSRYDHVCSFGLLIEGRQ